MTSRLTISQAIQVKGLQKSYKTLHVLKGVDFEVQRGSIFAQSGDISVRSERGVGTSFNIRVFNSVV